MKCRFFLFGLVFFFLLFSPHAVQAVTVQEFTIDTTTPREKVGYPAISDPTSKMVFPAYSWTPGGSGETLHHGPIAAGGNSFIANKAEPAATNDTKNKVFVSVFDIGVEPGEKVASYLETGDADSKMQWLYLNNKPSNIFNYQWNRDSVNQSLTSNFFTYQDRFHGQFTLNNFEEFGFSIRLTGSDGSNNLTGAIDTSIVGQPVITIYDAYSEYYVALGISDADQVFVDSAFQDPRYAFDTSKVSTSNSTTFAGMRTTNLSGTNIPWNLVVAMDRNQATAIAQVRTGLDNTASDMAAAQTYWQNYLTDTTIDSKLESLTELEKYSVCVSLNQLAANSYNLSYIAAGTPVFSSNFGRDTAYASLGLVHWKPTFAKNVLSWFAQDGWPSLATTDSIDFNGVAIPSENPTDWGAVYMYAAGYVFDETDDPAFAGEVVDQLNNLYDWVFAHYNATDRHITVSAAHTHDYWDQYAAAGTIDTNLIKYEAEVDLLWSKALTQAAPIFAQQGDTARATWATSTAAELTAGMSDYAIPGGGYYFAIKTDDTLYDDFIAAPPNLVAAYFFNDKGAFDYLKANASDLSLAGIPWENIGSTTYKEGITNLIDVATWSEIQWAGTTKRWGDGIQYNKILSLTGLGYIPASVRAENNDFIIGQHMENQSWSYGLLLQMIYNGNFVYPPITAGATVTATSTTATVQWETANSASSYVSYGLTSSYGSDSTETDTSPRVLSHSVTLINLSTCTTYHYQVTSRDIHNLSASSQDATFTTSGCITSNAPTTTPSSPASTAVPPTCNLTTPTGQADLFQINRNKNSATLYFTPVNDNLDHYHVIYGHQEGDQQFGLLSAPVRRESNTGVQSITINHLNPRQAYWFTVAPVNGCAVGKWSNWLQANKVKKQGIFYRYFASYFSK